MLAGPTSANEARRVPRVKVLDSNSSAGSGLQSGGKSGPPRRATVLVTVKASPEIGRAHGETVCVAGIRLDGDQISWIRLFPVQWQWFWHKTHPKYQIVELDITHHRNDQRPESHRPDLDSVSVVRQVPAGSQRAEILNRLPQPTMCGLLRESGWKRTSLALVVPTDVSDLTREDNSGSKGHDAKISRAAQGSLFAQGAPALEICPFTFRFRYRCEDPACGGHHQSIVDWEISEAWRTWRISYPTDFLQRIREKWMSLVQPSRLPAFFVGNQHQAPQGFLILGVARDIRPQRPPPTDQLPEARQQPSSGDTDEGQPQNTSDRLFDW